MNITFANTRRGTVLAVLDMNIVEWHSGKLKLRQNQAGFGLVILTTFEDNDFAKELGSLDQVTRCAKSTRQDGQMMGVRGPFQLDCLSHRLDEDSRHGGRLGKDSSVQLDTTSHAQFAKVALGPLHVLCRPGSNLLDAFPRIRKVFTVGRRIAKDLEKGMKHFLLGLVDLGQGRGERRDHLLEEWVKDLGGGLVIVRTLHHGQGVVDPEFKVVGNVVGTVTQEKRQEMGHCPSFLLTL